MEDALSRTEQRATRPERRSRRTEPLPKPVRRFRPLEGTPFREPTPAGATPGAMHVDRVAFSELVESTLAHWSPRRATAFAAYTVAWGGFRTLIDAAQRLDRRLFPELAEVQVRAPVFIFANPRSGTTLLHRLMSLDEENFVAMRLFESIFPAASLLRGFQKLEALDAKHLGGLLGRAVTRLDDATFGARWEDVHKLGLREPEEDECPFVYCLQTPTTMLLVPFVDEVKSHIWFDELPPAVRGRFMDYYEGVLRRLLMVAGRGRRYLDKNVFFTPRIRTMHERFPDGKFVYMVRHPYEALPSFLNMFYTAWQTHSPEIPKDSPEVRALLQVGIDYYRYALRCRDLLPAESFRVVRYDDLVGDPRATVESLYRWMGLPISGAFRARLDEAAERQRSYERPTEHTLEEWGLSREDIYRELRPVFEEFGFAP